MRAYFSHIRSCSRILSSTSSSWIQCTLSITHCLRQSEKSCCVLCRDTRPPSRPLEVLSVVPDQSDCMCPVFTARCYASAVLAMALCPSVSVSLSVTSRCSTKTAKRRITYTTPHDSPGTLVFRSQRSPRNSTGVTPYGGAKYRWGGSKSATFDK